MMKMLDTLHTASGADILFYYFMKRCKIFFSSVGHIAKYGSQKHSVYMGMMPNNRQREKKVDQHVDV